MKTSKPNINATSFNEKDIECNFANLGTILSKSISNAISNVVMIGGFVVLFSVIVSILEHTKILEILAIPFYPICNLFHIDTSFISTFFSGIIELTNGVKNVSLIATKHISTNVIICSFLLGFGGISVALQVLGIISKTDISIKPYLLGKFLQGCFSAFYTYIALKYVSFFNLDLVAVFNSTQKSHPANTKFSWISIGFCLICILFVARMQYKRKYC